MVHDVINGGFMSKVIEGIIECPFYIKEGSGFITCEGVLEKTSATHRFNSNDDKISFEQRCCCVNGGRNCIHYRNVSLLYERGVRS